MLFRSVRLIAKAEAKKILEGGDPFMNIYLQSIFPERSRECLNRLRNRSVKWDYKGYVRKALDGSDETLASISSTVAKACVLRNSSSALCT